MKTAKVIILNLLILTLAFVAMIIAGRIETLIGLNGFQTPFSIVSGLLFIALGVFLRSLAAYTFYDHKLRVLELRGQHALLQTGIYAHSRNPLYISIVLVILGCALLLGSPLGVLFAVLSFISWHGWVYFFEEGSLEEQFGEEYREYKRQTPRWIGWRSVRRLSIPWRMCCLSGIVALLIITLTIPLSGQSFILIHCPSRESQRHIEDHTTEIKGLTVYYRTAGEPSAQPVVFLHGWGARLGKRCSTDHVIEALAEHFFVIAPEHPGLIRSQAPKTLWSYNEYAEALHMLLSQLHLQKPVMVGQSFGGGIASAYAENYPQSISALVLIDSVMSNRPYSLGMRIKHTWDSFSLRFFNSSLVPVTIKKGLLSLWVGAPWNFLSEETIRERSIMSRIDKYKDLEEPLEIDYPTIQVPLILVWGDRDTWNTPIRRAKEIHADVPASSLIVVSGTHTVLYQRPQEIVDQVQESLLKLGL